MNQKHGIDNSFFKVFKRSFLPDASENPARKEKVQKTSFDNDTASVVHASPWDQYDNKSNINLEQSDDQVTPLNEAARGRVGRALAHPEFGNSVRERS